jgi:serine/threonine protein kinase
MGKSSPNKTEALRTLGKYALIEKLGEGHLGPVFRGFDQDLDKPVVVRILSEDIRWDANIEHFFSQVCKTVAGLEHPNIVSILDFGKEAQSTYVVMESLGSGNLKSLINEKPDMPVEVKLSIMIQVAAGLSYAHKKTILHRDLKPDKIHLMPDGGIKIRDFAMAHILTRHLPRRVVHWREPIYLSPEQIQKKDSDERSDIYSAGTIFYELLTYIHPFHDSNNSRAIDSDNLNNSIPTFDQFPDVPPGFWPILKTCMAADPEDRYKSMDDLVTACKDLQKSLAEDAQLMLAELYASQNCLKKAAAQPNASANTMALFRDIKELSRGDKKPDCVTLDRMTTALIEQYPIIQAAVDDPDAMDPQLDFEIPEAEVTAQDSSDTEPIPSEETIEEKEISEANPEHFEKPEPELQHSSLASGVKPDKDLQSAPVPIEDADIQPNAIQQDSSEVHSFDLDHRHGVFGGSCRGVLLMSCQSIEYNPFCGQHSFRVPRKLLKISKIDRKFVKLSFVSDNKHFESFKFQDDTSAERFYRVWEDLKTIQQ